MSAVLDVVQVAAPGLTALGGAYYGARWQAGREADAELRVVVDQAIGALQGVTRAVFGARSLFIQERARTTPAGFAALAELEQKVADAQEVRDRLLVRTEADSALPVHFLNALLAVGRANDPLRTAAVWPESEADSFDEKDAWDKINGGIQDLNDERASFLQAAQARVAPRPGLLRRLLNRAKLSERRRSEERQPITDAPDSGDG
jgi:hypothetical protein